MGETETTYEIRVIAADGFTSEWWEDSEASALRLLNEDGFEVRRRQVSPWEVVPSTR